MQPAAALGPLGGRSAAGQAVGGAPGLQGAGLRRAGRALGHRETLHACAQGCLCPGPQQALQPRSSTKQAQAGAAMEDSDARSVGSSATGISTLSARIASLAVYEDRAGFRPGIAEADELLSQPDEEEEEEELVEMTEEQVRAPRCRDLLDGSRRLTHGLPRSCCKRWTSRSPPSRWGPTRGPTAGACPAHAPSLRLVQVCSRLFRPDGGAHACKQLTAEQLQSLRQQGCAPVPCTSPARSWAGRWSCAQVAAGLRSWTGSSPRRPPAS